VSSPADRPDQEPTELDLKKIKSVRPREYLIRFAFGASISIIAGILTLAFGPRFGGLFLAFPAILPATLTLLQKKDGLAQATADVRGAVIGSVGMIAFATVAMLLIPRSPAAGLATALVAWLAVSAVVYLVLRLLARGLGERQYLPEIPTEEAATVIEVLQAHRFTLALAESCTGGTIAALLTGVPGAGDVIRGGIVTWNEDTKRDPLGVDAEVLAEHGPVSPHVARQMAHRVKKLLRADIGFAIVGLEGRSEGGKPPGLTYLAIATPDNTDRGSGRNRERDVRTSFDLIRRSLEGERAG
jgi:PncC family amidohydrolase